MTARDAYIKAYLELLVERYNRPEFIGSDPVACVHAFDDPRDQEIIGLFAALFAWGRRDVVLRKLFELCERLNLAPRWYALTFERHEGESLRGFVHRTWSEHDLCAFWRGLGRILRRYGSLEAAFYAGYEPQAPTVEGALERFIGLLEQEVGRNARRHLRRPSEGSSCKRLNLYLRWMVRRDRIVDLGIWAEVNPAQLIIPLDVHVGRVARALGLLRRKSTDWRAARELTERLRVFDPEDPVRYDFALFGLGVFREPLPDLEGAMA
ncbi:MAG: TIGR02757 family protein [Bacteroidetes bacterium]|nr:TIGR02757 family protein [Rhodothermia bacterium]MCS7156008.1 TIGR02757 family protein [Bacteroidota bacterium]MCX7907696.1 TIGR02757 family protein [Bacteroidota bacterium]MDW8137825.1 TIGR02757 family protein [Bacteroidota bacterium]MDW8286324.1 TIGR02757 family protein [Bacteroidota bacterium]